MNLIFPAKIPQIQILSTKIKMAQALTQSLELRMQKKGTFELLSSTQIPQLGCTSQESFLQRLQYLIFFQRNSRNFWTSWRSSSKGCHLCFGSWISSFWHSSNLQKWRRYWANSQRIPNSKKRIIYHFEIGTSWSSTFWFLSKPHHSCSIWF